MVDTAEIGRHLVIGYSIKSKALVKRPQRGPAGEIKRSVMSIDQMLDDPAGDAALAPMLNHCDGSQLAGAILV